MDKLVRTLIVYYSRTGTTRALAAALADALGADLAEIRCKRYQGGLFRYLRAGYDSVKGNLPPIEVPPVAAADYDLVLIGGPVWTSHPALPIRAYLAGAPPLPDRIGLFLTYGGHSPARTAIEELAALLPGPFEASLSAPGKDVGDGSIANAIGIFVDLLTEKEGQATDTDTIGAAAAPAVIQLAASGQR